MEGSAMEHVVIGVYMGRDTMARFEQMSVGDGEGGERRIGGPYHENRMTV
jgi:hypothetical protein